MVMAIGIFMAVCLMTLGYVFRRPAIALGAAGAWLVAAMAAYVSSAVAWDMYYGMFWFCMVLVIVAAFEAFFAREKRAEEEGKKSEWDAYADDMETRRERNDRLRGLRRRNGHKRESKYSRTGRPD